MSSAANTLVRIFILLAGVLIFFGRAMAQADERTNDLGSKEALPSVTYQVLGVDGKPVIGAFVYPRGWYDCIGISNKDKRFTTTDTGSFSLPIGDKPQIIAIVERIFHYQFTLNPGRDYSLKIQLPQIPAEYATHVLSVELADENDQKITGPSIEIYKDGMAIHPFLHQSVFDWTGMPTGKLFLRIGEWRKFAAADFSFSVLENTNYNIKIKLCSKYKARCDASFKVNSKTYVAHSLDTGAIKGVVLDSEGHGLSGILLKARTVGVKAALTNTEGDFVIPYLTPGCYELSVEKREDFNRQSVRYNHELIRVMLGAGDVLVLKIYLKQKSESPSATRNSSP